MGNYAREQNEVIQQKLIENYSHYYRLAYSFVKNEPDAMDIVQEAACKAIYKSSSLKNSEYAGTWICRIVINEAYHVLRTKQKESCNLEKPEQVCEDIYQDLDLQRAIRQLNEKEREIIYLRYGLATGKEVTQREIGQMLGISRSYVSRIEKKALHKLRTGFERE